MFNRFRKNKPSIKSISIPTFDWDLINEDKTIKQWINPEQTMAFSVNFFDSEPDLPSLEDIDMVRNYYRGQIIQANGGLIQVDLVQMGHFKMVKTIFKIQQGEPAITYLTSLTIPFKTCSYVIKIQAPQIGITGMRESMIADRLLKENVIQTDDSGYIGWSKDPYLPEFKKGFLMNLSEKSVYDTEFPEHPLSISRELISQIEAQIEMAEILENIKQYNP